MRSISFQYQSARLLFGLVRLFAEAQVVGHVRFSKLLYQPETNPEYIFAASNSSCRHSGERQAATSLRVFFVFVV
jgi:hypothetical protein